MNASYIFTDSHSIPWRKSTMAEGVEVKDLGTVNGRSMQLVRCVAGAHFPAHIHKGPEFIYLIEGEAVQNGQRLSPGWGSAVETGTSDEAFYSPTGYTFLIVYTENTWREVLKITATPLDFCI